MNEERSYLRAYVEALERDRGRLKEACKTLQWYAESTYPDDGSGRPPEAYRRRAIKALEIINPSLLTSKDTETT